jgi:hypothetical protein
MATSTNPVSVLKSARLGQGHSQLVFPSDIKHEYCSITAVEYQRDLPHDTSNLRATSQSVILPIPLSGMDDNYALDYRRVDTGGMGGTLNSILDVAGADSLGAGLGKFGRAIGGAALSGIDELTRNVVGGAVKGVNKAVGSNLNPATAKAITQQFQGRVANPNMSMSFMGVNARVHDFSWKLIPKSPEESATIQRILHFFRSFALPKKTVGASFQLNYPHLFLMEIFGPQYRMVMFSDQGLFLNGINISYVNESHPTFFKDTGMPVSVNLNISFLERMLTTQDDVDAFFTFK